MVTMTASRTGRQFQRYNRHGSRQVVGCIPYRLKNKNQSHILVEELEVLLISSQKSTKMMFPKGGWEMDESMEEAASRECIEEAGIGGIVGYKLGKWNFKSKSQPKFHEGHMFSLQVTEELEVWPEQNVRQRVWMSVKEARELCSHGWMIEALDKLVHILVAPPQRKEEEKSLDKLVHILVAPRQRKEEEKSLDKLVHILVAPCQTKEEEKRSYCSFEQEKRAYCSFEHRIIISLAHSGEEVESFLVS